MPVVAVVRAFQGRQRTATTGGAVLSLVFGLLTQFMLTNQVATGLALTLFGQGLSSMIGQGYNGIKPPATTALPLGPLAEIPVLGTILFRHDWMVYTSILIIAAVWAVLKYTRTGLILRAVGESHDAAHALGYKVVRIRIFAILFGGAMAGLGGAYVSLVRVPQWTDGITAGAAIPVEYLSMSPYLITILVLVIMSSGRGKAALNAPAALGQNFHASR